MTAGVRLLGVRIGGLEGESCTMVANLDWLAMLALIDKRLRDDEEDCEGEEEMATVLGTVKGGGDGLVAMVCSTGESCKDGD